MFTRIRRFLSLLLGDFSWRPPSWLAGGAASSRRWVGAHRRASAALAVLLVALGMGAWEGWVWYRDRPRPVTVAVTVQPPGPTPMGDVLKPEPMIVNFGSSVARLEDLHHPLFSGARLDPPVEGKWEWLADDRLSFQPKRDWPAGQVYRVILERSLFPEHILLASYNLEMQTAALKATMPKLEFYTDPTDPTVKQITGTFEFSHPVSVADLEKHLELTVIGGTEVFPKDTPRFTITAGKQQRIMYLRTSALSLPEHEDFLRVRLDATMPTLLGGITGAPLEKRVTIPDLYSFFKINSATGRIVHNKEGEPEQILFLETRGACRSEELLRSLHVYLLPKKHPEKEDDDTTQKWESAREVDEEVVKNALLLPVKLVPSGEEESELHSFRISLETKGQLYVTVDKGARALGGFLLGEKYEAIVRMPEFPREIEIQGEGGVLALNGERKLSIRSRGVDTIEYEIGRVPADQINHLVSQTRGEFQNPDFVYGCFGRQNIARMATERQAIEVQSRFKSNFSTFDFSRYLRPADDGGTPLQGLFFLRATEWHGEDGNKDAAAGKREVVTDDGSGDGEDDADDDDEGDRYERGRGRGRGDDDRDEEQSGEPAATGRFILVTDLGLVVKENADQSRDVFVASIHTGGPLAAVTIEVLAKNGLPLFSGQTGEDGRLNIPPLGHPEREKLPVAYVARLGSDVAFMPYARRDRQLDFSNFDIGGVHSPHGADLDGFVFTERGIYRPGDEIHIGLMVKQRDWQGHLEGLPIKTQILDARGEIAQERRLALPPGGFAETSYQTAYESPTGSYAIKVFLVTEDPKNDPLIAETSVSVKEFLPDRMKIESHLSREPKTGWITPGPERAEISLKNLYGTPASDRTVKGHLALSPSDFDFEEFPGFEFFDRLMDPKKERKRQSEDLGETKTDENGAAHFDLELERFSEATYEMTFHVEGFEAESGRSVATSNRLLVSPQPWVIGAKKDGNFDYVQMGSQRVVEWIALNPALEKIALPALECRLIEHTYVSVLSKKEDGDYGYESVLRDQTVHTAPLALPAEGLKYPLPTEVPGEYSLELWDKENAVRVSSVSFSVIGQGAVSRSLEKNAELQVKLSRPDYNTGDDIEIGIVAPYTGSGLITIERDKVYAHAWFKADSTSSVQHIRVPEGFEGTGYINVCFIRGLDSKEVFMSPLSYAVAPFQANLEKRRLPITLTAAAKAKPGEPLRIGYKTDRPSRIVIFAVDQGILQVTDYQTPDPLDRFFRKAALLVETRQILDLILTEFSLLRNASAFGGDGEKHLNPFKRVTEKPVVFWSGIVDAGPREQEVVYEVPDYFSGTLTVMAVAVAPDAVGSEETESVIRGPFVLTPNVPTVAAPGDLFEVSVTVANGVEGSGEKAAVQVSAIPSEHLEIVEGLKEPMSIPEGREASATFKVRAKEKFGSASLLFRASTKGQETSLRSTLSVRPAVPFMTSVQSTRFTGYSSEVKLARKLHPDFRKEEVVLSAVPLGLARGLDTFLHNYPNGCSEQISSGAFARLALAGEADFGLSRKEVAEQMEHTFSVLRHRQNDQGGFGYWTAEPSNGIDFISAYVMHFLIEAKEAGFPPPAGMIESGLKHLQAMATRDPADLREARIQAFAIYLLTRESVITTNYALNLQEFLDRTKPKRWQGDLAAVYLAGTWALLQKNDEAERLIKGYRLGAGNSGDWWDFNSLLASDSQYVAVVARHFPQLMSRITPEEFGKVTGQIADGQFSTLSAAYAVLALKSYSHAVAQSAPALGAMEIGPKGALPLRMEGSPLLRRGAFSPDAKSIRFTAQGPIPRLGIFSQVVQSGYDLALPAEAVHEGLEVFRDLADAKGAPVQIARLGEPITVRLRLRSLRANSITNVAIVDLLPGGFEFTPNGLRAGAGSAGFDYVDLREDRAIFFGTIGTQVREVQYSIKPTNRGVFTVPPAFAESMYDRTAYARALAGQVTVIDAQ